MIDNVSTHASVREYYGDILSSNKDLKTSACCSTESMPQHHRDILAKIDPEILDRFYGCGSPIPEGIEGCTVLDLGCGSGRDVYLLSHLVGPEGHVIGIDMTEEQLAVARRHADTQADRFGYAHSNVVFHHGYIEELAGADIADNSVDLVVSNCVINLSPHKDRVFSEIFRVLKPAGELYFSDVFAGRRIAAQLRRDPVLRGECLGGAMYTEDFRRLLQALGCADHREMSCRRIALDNEELERKVGMIDFYAITKRAFKLDLEDICEDYGQVAVYRGTIPHCPHSFILDDHHEFVTGKPMLVCGNTADMLSKTRFAPHFRIDGDKAIHFGPFDCAPAVSDADAPGGGACC